MNEFRQIVESTVDVVLQKMNVVPEIITLSQIKKLYGRALAKSARESRQIEWFPMGRRGKGVEVYCRREQFLGFLFRNPFQ